MLDPQHKSVTKYKTRRVIWLPADGPSANVAIAREQLERGWPISGNCIAPSCFWVCVWQLCSHIGRAYQDSLAEWSKALAQGASPQGRGLEPHSCHVRPGPRSRPASPPAEGLGGNVLVGFCGFQITHQSVTLLPPSCGRRSGVARFGHRSKRMPSLQYLQEVCTSMTNTTAASCANRSLGGSNSRP